MHETEAARLRFDTPPRGSTIEVVEDFEGRTYRWRPAQRPPAQWILVLWGAMMVPVIIAFVLMLALIPAERKDVIVLLVAIIAQIAFAAWLFRLGLSRRGCETLTLGRNLLRFDTGPPSLPLPVVLFMWPMGMHWSGWFTTGSKHPTPLIRKRYAVPWGEIGDIALSRVGEHQRLTVDHGADRIEIGMLLREPEREWLAAVLRAWRDHPERS